MQLFSSELMGVHVLGNTVLVPGPSERLLFHMHSFLFLKKKQLPSALVWLLSCWCFHLHLCFTRFQKIFPASLFEHLSYCDILSTQKKKRSPQNPNKTSNTGVIIKKPYKLQNEPEAKIIEKNPHVLNPKTVCLPLLVSDFTWSSLTWGEFSAIPLAYHTFVFGAYLRSCGLRAFFLILNLFVLLWDITMTLLVDAVVSSEWIRSRNGGTDQKEYCREMVLARGRSLHTIYRRKSVKHSRVCPVLEDHC